MGKKVCIFCGSKLPNEVKYKKFANQISQILIEKNYSLVYGGAKVGLMGEMAKNFLNAKKEVIGVIPQELVDMEVAHDGLSKLHVVTGMHKRKELMYQLSDIFFVIPGGLGTMDELFEIWTWKQLKFHDKPIFILNHEGYYEYLKLFLERAVNEGFVSKEHAGLVRFVNGVDELITHPLI